MTANELAAAIMTERLGGLSIGQMSEFIARVADRAPDVYDQVLADMREDGSLD